METDIYVSFKVIMKKDRGGPGICKDLNWDTANFINTREDLAKVDWEHSLARKSRDSKRQGYNFLQG